jgi:hypothetical protein
MLASSFADITARWTVGLGIEHQLLELLQAQSPLCAQQTTPEQHRINFNFIQKAYNLDYAALVRPEVVEATLTGEVSCCLSCIMNHDAP